MASPNPQDYWFKRRRYGWGWTPVRREGWFLVAGFAAALIVPALLFGNRFEDNGWALVLWLIWVVVTAAGFIVLTTRHAPPGKWRWGTRPDDDPDLDI
jgi:hypothetical protein